MSFIFGGFGGRSRFEGDRPINFAGDKVLVTTELVLFPNTLDAVRYFPPPPPDFPRAMAPLKLLVTLLLLAATVVASSSAGEIGTWWWSGDNCAVASAGNSSVFLPLFLEVECGAGSSFVLLSGGICEVKPIVLEQELELLSSLIFA